MQKIEIIFKRSVIYDRFLKSRQSYGADKKVSTRTGPEISKSGPKSGPVWIIRPISDRIPDNVSDQEKSGPRTGPNKISNQQSEPRTERIRTCGPVVHGPW